jgi:rhomboid protease GluP
VRDFWLASAEQAAGNIDTADAIFRRLAAAEDAALRRAAQRRLLTPLPAVNPAALLASSRVTLERLENALREELLFGLTTGGRGRRTPATAVFVAINVAAFALEIPGGTMVNENLVRLGALVIPYAEVSGQWWRVVTAGFLHFGALHLLLNIGGLWFFGRYIERVWGRGLLITSYLVATVAGNAIAWWILESVYDSRGLAVGASGGVMGLLGAALAAAAIRYRRTGARVLKRQVAVFGALLVMQTLFDVSTPNVSTTIHLSGLGLGLLVGAFMSWRAPPT